MTDLPPVPRCNKEKLSSHSAGYSELFCCMPYPVPLNIQATSKSIKGSSLCLSVCCQCASLNVISSCPSSPSCHASQRPLSRHSNSVRSVSPPQCHDESSNDPSLKELHDEAKQSNLRRSWSKATNDLVEHGLFGR